MFAVALWLGYLLLCLLDLGLLIVLSITVLCYLVLVARGLCVCVRIWVVCLVSIV